jgi:predicted flap endonuclease-1-like 5' DNA nuclease
MWYLITQTAIFILVAGAVGLWLGWYLGKLSRDPELNHLHNRLRAHGNAEDSAEQRARAAEARLAELSGRLAERENADRELAQRVEQLEEQAEVCAVNLRDCQAARSELESEAARMQEALRQRDNSPLATAKEPVANASPADRPETLPEASGEADDLRRIKGIGPRIAALLNDMGITRYRQLADLTPEGVAEIDERLKFRGRIVREKWVEQARELTTGAD